MTTLETLIFNLVVQNSIRFLEHVWNFIVVFVIFFLYMLFIVTCDVAMLQIQGKKKIKIVYEFKFFKLTFNIIFFPRTISSHD